MFENPKILHLTMLRCDLENNTALHLAVKSGDIALVKALLRRNPKDITSRNNEGYTPLHIAAEDDNLEAFLAIFSGREKDLLGLVTNTGDTVLHLATGAASFEIVRFLLENKEIDPNAKDEHGDTVLHLATLKNHAAVVATLLRLSSIDINEKDNDGNTPRDLAARNANQQIINLLANFKGSSPLPLFMNNGEK